MTELLGLPGERVLEIGTGSGYQAAVLAEMPRRSTPSRSSRRSPRRPRRLRLGYRTSRCGRRWLPGLARGGALRRHHRHRRGAGIPSRSCSSRDGGRLVIPVGEDFQELGSSRAAGAVRRKQIIPVRFVPMTGEAQRQ